ncbi:Riboflavin transporter RibU [Bifidobacterium catenulatum]|uniref:ECF transporter S component n=1 Tax=Bifidobacterium TaxID=1678 RepID=UPI00116CAE8B|nr:ECF transporter S component [Bifidobacterium catenulatum]GDZ45829.1 riboflavin transporter [Bifidobacteriaceae bacterium MCC02033]VUX33708.1 Riboflavin transporter RibU [Bifidobacterium catenulatum]
MEETGLNMSVSSPNNTQNNIAEIASESMTRPDNAHSTGVADSGRWSTKRIAMYALFVALSMAVSFVDFPIMPGVEWLKYDPSGIVSLVAGFAYGPAAAAIVSVLGFLPHLFTNPWGTLMAVLVALALSVPAALIYRRNKTRKGAVIGIIVGAIVALVVAIVGNLIVTPFYAHMTTAQVVALIVPALLPFNALKFTIHGVITFLIYKPISNLLNR